MSEITKRKEIILLEEARKVIEEYVNECGGCDHSVGICMCLEINLLDEIDDFLLKKTKLR